MCYETTLPLLVTGVDGWIEEHMTYVIKSGMMQQLMLLGSKGLCPLKIQVLLYSWARSGCHYSLL